MKLLKTILASAVLVASAGADASVIGATTGSSGVFATLSGPGGVGTGGTLSGTVSATIVGGQVQAADLVSADNLFPGENFLAAGPTPGGFGVPNTATMTFAGAGIPFISFLWGSPDTYNTLTVNSTGGGSPQIFTAAGLGFSTTNGDQSVNQFVQFTGVGASLITSLVFVSTIDAFETARFSTTAIPEPETYAMLLAGLGLMGFIARRRKHNIA